MSRLWRLGASAAARNGALCTIWEYDPAEDPDEQGRRPSDRLAGALGREDAERAVTAVNALPHEKPPGVQEIGVLRTRARALEQQMNLIADEAERQARLNDRLIAENRRLRGLLDEKSDDANDRERA